MRRIASVSARQSCWLPRQSVEISTRRPTSHRWYRTHCLVRKNIINCRPFFSHRLLAPSALRHSTSQAAVTEDGRSAVVGNGYDDDKEMQQQSPTTVPIDFDTASQISGQESQILEVYLQPNQVLRAESGAMLYMTHGITMNTTMGEGGFLSSGMKRLLTGQNLFLADYKFEEESPRDDSSSSKKKKRGGTVALGTDFPSKIIRLELDDYTGNKIICQKGAFLAGSHTVQIEVEFAKKLRTGFFGGEGFVLQGLQAGAAGDVVFVKAGGTLVKRELKAGEVWRVSSGCLVAFTQTVDFDVQMMPGFKNVMFGGEGLFMTTLTGPGTIWLQGMPPNRMIGEIARRVPSGIPLGIPIGMGGASSGDNNDAGGGTEGGVPLEGAAATGEAAAVTDAAADADRQATVASSGGQSGLDAESPSALFGDAAPPNSGATDSSTLEKNDDSTPDLDDSTTSFSTDESTSNVEDDTISGQEFGDFAQDDTSFTTNDVDQKDDFGASDDFDTGTNSVGDSDNEGGLGSLFSRIWDFFSNNDE